MKQEANTPIKKSISHLKKVSQMIADDIYCIDIIQQIQAVQGYLNSAKKTLLENHMRHCYKEALESKSPSEEERVLKELLKVVSKA